MITLRYNDLGVISLIVVREHVKALVDRLSDEQVKALWILLNAMVWPEVEISAEDEADIKEGLADLEAGRKVRAEDAFKQLGI